MRGVKQVSIEIALLLALLAIAAFGVWRFTHRPDPLKPNPAHFGVG